MNLAIGVSIDFSGQRRYLGASFVVVEFTDAAPFGHGVAVGFALTDEDAGWNQRRQFLQQFLSVGGFLIDGLVGAIEISTRA